MRVPLLYLLEQIFCLNLRIHNILVNPISNPKCRHKCAVKSIRGLLFFLEHLHSLPQFFSVPLLYLIRPHAVFHLTKIDGTVASFYNKIYLRLVSIAVL